MELNKLNPFDSPAFAVLIREANYGGLNPIKTIGLARQGPGYILQKP